MVRLERSVGVCIAVGVVGGLEVLDAATQCKVILAECGYAFPSVDVLRFGGGLCEGVR